MVTVKNTEGMCVCLILLITFGVFDKLLRGEIVMIRYGSIFS